ncbi:membrane protein [Nocardia sputorum]|nr:membrane protein [Nocardia sputorum]
MAYGPILCLAVLVLELVTGGDVHWFALVFCAALIAGFVALQVVAGKRHVSVELTSQTLRSGTESLPLSSIAQVLPERDEDSWDDEEWESARALGELTGVPRRRTGIGLRLADGGLVQAWARDHKALRTALTEAVQRSSDGVDR